ncbi:MAG TPA: hypothetical protein VFJ82_04115 [Longimicrobium sp.]|nr:hypothetical protein [Longimicrobium sp.]
MSRHRSRALVLAALSLGACDALRGKPDVEVSAGDANLNTRWHATLASPRSLAGAVQMSGEATMAPTADGRTTVALALANATAGGLHPWQLHRGQCGADRGVLGAAAAYAPLRVGGDGRATASATLPIATPADGPYFVSVQASSGNPGTVVACGNLAPPTR